MPVFLKVDCENLRIILTLKIWVGPNVPAKHIKAIRKAVRERLNPTKPPLYYFRCRVYIRIEISRAKNQPNSYDQFKINGSYPDGGGATLQPGGGLFAPGSRKFIGVSTLPDGSMKPSTISHELGHALGINDPEPTTPWDKDGINDDHIREIFDNGSMRLPDGTLVGWHASAHCCRATHHAVTTRVRGD